MTAAYVVVIQAPGRPPETRELSLHRIVIGRDAGDLIVPDARCSSTHAEILFDGTHVRVRDLGSTNGTLVNGQRADDVAWSVGMVLQIGSHTLTLQEIRAAGPGRGKTVAGNVAMAPAPQPGMGFSPTVAAGPGISAQAAMAPTAMAPAGMQGAGYAPPQAPAGAPGPSAPPFGAPGPSAPPFGAPHAQPHAQPPHAPPGPAAMPPPPGGFGGGPAYPAPRGLGAPKKSGFPVIWIVLPIALLATCGVGAGALFLLSAQSTTTAQPGEPAPTMTEPRETSVKFVWFSGGPGPTAKGGTSPARIRVGPNKAGTVSVGVAEEFAGGGGNQWRTATWLAAFNATRTTGKSLSDYEFNVHVGGHVDGPSAGMLTTATMLALIHGKTPRPDTTMTGTINPDGTAGPVGGIAQKMEGAKASGLKRFGFPIGCRNHKDMRTGQDVDLMSVGQGLGLEAKEIGDIYEGYEFLTGDKLVRVEPIAEPELEVPTQTQALLRAKVVAWKARVDRELGNLKAEVKRTGLAVQTAGPLIADADKSFEKAQRYERNGYLVPALDSYAETAIQIAAATRMTTAAFHIQRRNLSALLDAVQTAEKVKPEVESLGAQLEVKAQGGTRGGQIATTYAFQHYVTAKSATMIGDDFLQGAIQIIKGLESGQIKPTQEAIALLMMRVTAPTLYYDIARVYLDYAKDLQDLIVDEGAAKPLDPTTLDRTVSGYASASSAVFAYFDALIVEEIAKENNMTADDARVLIAQREAEYYLGRKANGLAEYTGKEGAGPGVKLMRLGAASLAYLTGAKLVNKWYSLSASFDKEGHLVLDNKKALTAQLELARRTAREAATRSKTQAGFVPTAAKLAFQQAGALREGSDEDKLNALASYWHATFWSELAAVGATHR